MCVVGQSSLDNPDMFPGGESLTVKITTRHCAGFSSSGFSELLQSVDLCLSLILEILGGCIFEYFFSPFSPVPWDHPSLGCCVQLPPPQLGLRLLMSVLETFCICYHVFILFPFHFFLEFLPL